MVPSHFTRIRDYGLFVERVDARREQKRAEGHDVGDACAHSYFEEKIGLKYEREPTAPTCT